MTTRPLLLAAAAFLTSLYAAFNPPTLTLENAISALDQDVQKNRDPRATLDALDRQFDVMLKINARLLKAASLQNQSLPPKGKN